MSLRNQETVVSLCGTEYPETRYKLSGHFSNDEISKEFSDILQLNQLDQELVLRQAPTGVMVVGRMIKLCSVTVKGAMKMSTKQVSNSNTSSKKVLGTHFFFYKNVFIRTF